MIRAGALFITLALCGAAPAIAERQSANAFCVADENFIDRFADRLGWTALNRQHDFPALVECLVRLDNTTNTDLAEFMPRMYAALLKSDPHTFIRVMAQHPRELRHWLDNLGQAFVWEGDPPSPMEGERQHLIALLQATQVDPGDDAVRSQILRRLLEVRAHTIN